MKKRKIIYTIIGITSAVLTYSFLNKQVNDMTNVEQILTNEIERGKSPSVQYYIFDKESIIKSFHLVLPIFPSKNKPI